MADAVIEVGDDAEIEVEIPNLLAEDEGVPAKTAAAVPAVDDAAAALGDAARKLENERRARVAAEATAMSERNRANAATAAAGRAQEEARTATESAATNQLVIINNGIEAAANEIIAAKAAHKAAFEAGDADKMADANERLGSATAARDRLTASKVDFEAGAVRKPVHEGRVEQQPVQTDTFERYLGDPANRFTPRAQSFLRTHREFAPDFAGGDATKNAMLMEGHYAAVKQKLTPDSDAYFEFLEKHIDGGEEVAPAPLPAGGKTSRAADVTPAAAGDGAARPARPVQRTPQPSAPVSREPLGANGQPTGGKQTVRLSPQQQEIALVSFKQNQGEDDVAFKKRAYGLYALGLVEATNAGKIGRMTH